MSVTIILYYSLVCYFPFQQILFQGLNILRAAGIVRYRCQVRQKETLPSVNCGIHLVNEHYKINVQVSFGFRLQDFYIKITRQILFHLMF